MCCVTANFNPIITWFDTINNTAPSEMITTTGNMSTLTYNPLSASHAGTYTCRATASDQVWTDTQAVIVHDKYSNFYLLQACIQLFRYRPQLVCFINIYYPDPPVAVRVDTGVATPMAGSMYSLTCTVTGAERLTDSTRTYQWFKDGVMVSDQTMETFSFTPLSFSDAGRYTCQATVMSSLLSGPITTNSSNSLEVVLTCEFSVIH